MHITLYKIEYNGPHTKHNLLIGEGGNGLTFLRSRQKNKSKSPLSAFLWNSFSCIHETQMQYRFIFTRPNYLNSARYSWNVLLRIVNITSVPQGMFNVAFIYSHPRLCDYIFLLNWTFFGQPAHACVKISLSRERAGCCRRRRWWWWGHSQRRAKTHTHTHTLDHQFVWLIKSAFLIRLCGDANYGRVEIESVPLRQLAVRPSARPLSSLSSSALFAAAALY